MNNLPTCQRRENHSKIHRKENGRKITLINDKRSEYVITQVDGCVVTGTLAADFVISRADKGDLVVELKGRNVEHAYEQVKATADLWCRKGLRRGLMAGIIICAQSPRMTTRRQRAELDFARICQGRLRIINRNLELNFDDLF